MPNMANMAGVRPMLGNQQAMGGNIPNAAMNVNNMNIGNAMNAQAANANPQMQANMMNQMGGQMAMGNNQMNNIMSMNMQQQQQQMQQNQVNPAMNPGQIMMGRMNVNQPNANAPQIHGPMGANSPANIPPNISGNPIPPNQMPNAGQMNLNQMLNPISHMGRNPNPNVLYQGKAVHNISKRPVSISK